MTVKHNITVAIEANLLKKARALAARGGRSVSALLADQLRELVAQDAEYAAAKKAGVGAFVKPASLRRQASSPRRVT